MIKQVTYDIEVYPNAFTFVSYHPDTNVYYTFEVSYWKSEWKELYRYLNILKNDNIHMVGYYNLYFDYPVVHALMAQGPNASAKQICIKAYKVCRMLIETPFNDRNKVAIWHHKQEIPQIDLYKIWHFDNPSRTTSLKMLEFVLRKKDIKQLPFDPNKPLTRSQLDELLIYNKYDVEVTEDFRKLSTDAITLREDMHKEYGKYMMLASDSSMGEHVMKAELTKKLGLDALEYKDLDGVKHIRKTKRDRIVVSDCIFPYVKFKTPQFQAILNYISSQVISETKGFFSGLNEDKLREAGVFQYSEIKYEKGLVKNLNVVFDGIPFVFGTGGLHASRHKKSFEANDKYDIVDVDVTSYYPSLAIENDVFPAHLSVVFCRIYDEIKQRRVKHAKGSAMNLALKLALNAVYGKSNSEFSPFFDAQYTMTITLNGQLLLAMLAEQYVAAGFQILQANTDGITVRIKKTKRDKLAKINKKWEKMTKLQLEDVDYAAMFLRDVNNYIGVYNDGNMKRKGAYEWDLLGSRQYHKDHSALVVQKAVEAVIASRHACYPETIEDFITNHDDVFDFYLRSKMQGQQELRAIDNCGDYEVEQKITRYYMSNAPDALTLMKKMPPMRKRVTKKMQGDWKKLGVRFNEHQEQRIGKYLQLIKIFTINDVLGYDPREQGIAEETVLRFEEAIDAIQPQPRINFMHVGYTQKTANTTDGKKPSDIDYDYYIAEAQKLVTGLGL